LVARSTDEARDAARRAVELAESLHARDTTNLQGRNLLAMTQDDLAWIDFIAGRYDEALAAARAAVALREALVAQEPRSELWKRNLAITRGVLGEILLEAGRSADAMPALDEELATATRLVAGSPSNDNVGVLTYALFHFGDAQRRFGRPLVARERLRLAL